MENKYELTIRASIRQVEPYYGGSGLQLEETVTIQAETFFVSLRFSGNSTS